MSTKLIALQICLCLFVLLFITTNTQTNALLSIKTPTMSSIINKKNHSIQLIHIIMFPLKRTIQKKKSKKKSHLVRNMVIMVVF